MSLAALLLGLAALPAGTAEVTHVDASMELDGRVLSVHSEDVDGDGRAELTVASYERASDRRELTVWEFAPDGSLRPEPRTSLPVLSDVVAWCWAEVRPEPGKELVFLTRAGAWSYSPTLPGYRGNIARLVEVDLLFDVPDLGTLPHWDYVLPTAGGDRLLLPSFGGYSLWVPSGQDDAEGRPRYAVRSRFEAAVQRVQTTSDDEGARVSLSADGLRIDGQLGTASLVDLGGAGAARPLVEVSNRVRAPALVDVDGDGRTDLLRLGGQALHVHLADEKGIAPDTTRSEDLPDYVTSSSERTFHLHDLDGDGDVDVLLHLVDEDDSVLSTQDVHRFLVLRNDGRLLPDQPHQLLKLEGSRIRPRVADVDGDGAVDLVLSRSRTGDLMEIASPQGFSLTRDVLVFRGEGGARFGRRPLVEHSERYEATRLDEGLSRRRMDMDCDGDGLADLVTVDLEGSVRIQRLEHESSFFGGDSWRLSETPWRRFPARADMRETSVLDVNGDGLGDVLSLREGRLVLLLSRRTGAGR